MRLSSPLNCIPLDEIKFKSYHNDRSIALPRIKSIISMASTKDNLSRFVLDPTFIEFDMSQEGFSCIFIPSIAPISTVGPSSGPTNLLTGAIVGNSDMPVSVNGGIGTGERAFPSQSGLTFTTWIYIERLNGQEEHTIQILTLYRSNQSNQDYTCFQMYINPKDKTLTVSTQETPIFSNSNCKVGFDSDHNIRLPVPELFERNWHHIALVLNRTLLKNSTVNVYINGKLKVSQKLHYISSIVGGNFGIANTSPMYINGFIGTPPQYRKNSNLIWKQGPCHLIEEPLNALFVSYIFNLGPNYIGSFQAINYIPNHLQTLQQQIAEDRLIFGLNSRATSIMTLSKMRRVYSKFDCKQIAKIIGLSTHENATPIYVLHNSAGHLCGPSRPLGGVLIGNIGARCFVPKQITLTFSDIGGSVVLLGLVANSKNMETLYASVKCLVCILKSNYELQLEMERINGYQMLSMLLKRKKELLNTHILHLLFNMILNLNSKHSLATSKSIYINLDSNFGHIPSFQAFKELLVDSIDVWIQSDLVKTLLEHFNEIIYDSTHMAFENKNKTVTIIHLREMNLLPRLISIFKNENIKDEKIIHLILVLSFKLLNQTTRSKDILYFGQFIVSLIPAEVLQKSNEKESNESEISLRNSLLKVVLQLMTRNTPPINCFMQEELVRVLGFDWFHLFLMKPLDKETITIGFVNLMLLLSNTNLYQKYKEGQSNGNWLKGTESFIENKTGLQLLGFNISTSSSDSYNGPNVSNINGISKDVLSLPGFQHLNWLLSNYVYEPQIYLIIFQTILCYYRNLIPKTLESVDQFEELSLENFLKVLLENKNLKKFKQDEIICKDLVLVVLTMVHHIFWYANQSCSKHVEYPKILIQFLKYLYNNNRDFRFYCQTNNEFLNTLCQTLINKNNIEYEYIEHPSKKLLLDFILMILVNIINMNQSTFTNSASNSFFSNQKPNTVFENILTCLSTCKKAQTEIISLFMDCIMSSQEFNLSTNAQLLSEPSNVILNFNSSYSNLVFLMSIVVDKLWLNCYLDDRIKILDCLTKMLKLNNSDSKSSYTNFKSFKSLTSQVSEINLLYKTTNRCILYFISRQIDSMSDRIFIFDVLQFIYSNRQVLIVSKCNNDSEFFICLTHCLLQLIDEEKISLSGSKDRTTWYVVETNKKVSSDEGALLIASVAKKIWDEIYLSKKQLLEDVLKISFTSDNSGFGITTIAPDISQLRKVLYEPTLKVWLTYIDGESQKHRRKPNSLSFDLPIPNSTIITEKLTNINKFNNLVTKSAGGLVSKIVGGTSGVVGTAISSAVGSTRKEIFRTASDASNYSVAVWALMPKEDVFYWSAVHASIVKDFLEFQLRQKQISDYHLRKYILHEWLNYEYEFLTREKAIWGPQYGSKRLDKWMLDMTEGPNRMRKKLIHNDQFYKNYPYRHDLDRSDGKVVKIRSAISLDSKEYFKRVLSEKYFLLDKDEDNQSFEFDMSEIPTHVNIGEIPSEGAKSAPTSAGYISKKINSKVLRSKSSSDYDDMEPDLHDSDSFDISEYVEINMETEKQGGPTKKGYDDNEMQTILRLLEEGEKISHMFRVARIQGLDSFEGLLLFGKEHFYLIDGFTLLKTREIRDIDSLPPQYVLIRQ